uniref:Protein kinase domain-containing protein n=1 Tax=Macrostomum lignano TaxID=282301 RepID=A0A1I8JS73_9PLAT
VPALASQPHFYQAAQHYIDSVIGLQPSPDCSTVLDVEPNTGLVMRAAKKLQINLALVTGPGFHMSKSMKPVFMPIMWVNESATIGSDSADQFRGSVLLVVKAAAAVQWGSLAVGLVCFLACLSACVCQRARRNRQNFNSDTRPDINDVGSSASSTVKWRVASGLLGSAPCCASQRDWPPHLARGMSSDKLAKLLPISADSPPTAPGAKPSLEQVGPFTFAETRTRDGVKFYENATMRGILRSLGQKVPEKFGLLVGKNNSAKGTALVGTGSASLANLSQVQRLERPIPAGGLAGSERLDVPSACVGRQLPEGFHTQTCAAAPTSATLATTRFERFLVLRFQVAKSSMMNASANPDNAAFCTPHCLDSGVLNLTLCLPGNPPIVASAAPHFHGAPTYRAAVSLQPAAPANGEPPFEFNTRLEVEPQYGPAAAGCQENAAKKLIMNWRSSSLMCFLSHSMCTTGIVTLSNSFCALLKELAFASFDVDFNTTSFVSMSGTMESAVADITGCVDDGLPNLGGAAHVAVLREACPSTAWSRWPDSRTADRFSSPLLMPYAWLNESGGIGVEAAARFRGRYFTAAPVEPDLLAACWPRAWRCSSFCCVICSLEIRLRVADRIRVARRQEQPLESRNSSDLAGLYSDESKLKLRTGDDAGQLDKEEKPKTGADIEERLLKDAAALPETD